MRCAPERNAGLRTLHGGLGWVGEGVMSRGWDGIGKGEAEKACHGGRGGGVRCQVREEMIPVMEEEEAQGVSGRKGQGGVSRCGPLCSKKRALCKPNKSKT